MEMIFQGIDITKIVGNIWYFILSLIVLDIVTGLLASAVERKLSSKINFNGMIKKIGELIALVFVTLVDEYFKANGQVTKLGVSMVVIYEGMSVIENLNRMGIDASFLTKYFDPSAVNKEDEENENIKSGH